MMNITKKAQSAKIWYAASSTMGGENLINLMQIPFSGISLPAYLITAPDTARLRTNITTRYISPNYQISAAGGTTPLNSQLSTLNPAPMKQFQ